MSDKAASLCVFAFTCLSLLTQAAAAGAVRRMLATAKISPVSGSAAGNSAQIVVPPDVAHGIWVQFVEQGGPSPTQEPETP